MKDITNFQRGRIIGVMSFIAIGTAFFFWNKYSPIREPRTAEQEYNNAYYSCVHHHTINNKDISNCNNIEKL